MSLRVLVDRPLSIVALLCALSAALLCASSSASGALPDGRVYEVVSPAASGQDANVYVENIMQQLSYFGEHGIWGASSPFQVAPSGQAVAYLADPPPTEGNGSAGAGSGNSYVARRLPGGGWTSVDVQPPGIRLVTYQAFSSDLSEGIVNGYEGANLAPGAFGSQLFEHSTVEGGKGEYRPFFTGTPPHRSPEEFGHYSRAFLEGEIGYGGANSGTSSVPSFSDLLFEANDALKPATPEAVEGGSHEDNLYDSVAGRLYLVNVLPNGTPQPGALFGSPADFLTEAHSAYPDLTRDISADGTRIFWSSVQLVENGNGEAEERPTALYVRENATSPDAATVQVDAQVGGGGRFWMANADGSRVLYTKNGDLYEYDVESAQTADLAEGGEVQGVLGASEREEGGGYVYFVAHAVLTTGVNAEGKQPLVGADNLYVSHRNGAARTLSFIGTLSAHDGQEVRPFAAGCIGAEPCYGDWQASLGYRTAEVTADGNSLLFMSNQSLTGYENKGLDEVFLYEAASAKLRCVSCNPTGEPPVPNELTEYAELKSSSYVEALFPMSGLSTYQPQAISEDGSRVFFDSAQGLVPQDNNGWLDVYEWERDGSGSCHESRGCIYLLSSGTDPENSYLIGASANGDDAFIVTRAQLVAEDRNDDDDLYDARVDGVEPPVEPACSGSGCQGVPPPPPIFATPSSVTFAGVGNFAPPAVTQAKTKAKPLTAAQKLAHALKECNAKRNVRKRALCKASARKRYGAKTKAKSDRGKKR